MTKSSEQVPKVKNEELLLGNLRPFAKQSVNFLFKTEKEYGKICELDFRIAKAYLISDPEYVKYVLQDNNKNYRKSLAYEIALKLLLGNGLLNSEDDFWRKQRRMAQPAFHKKRLQGFIDIMVSSTDILINRWQAFAKENKTFDAQTEMTFLTAEIVARAVFSSDVTGLVKKVNDAISDLNEYAIERLRSVVRLPLWLPTNTNRTYKKHYSFLTGMIGDIIKKREKSPEKQDDLLQMLIDARDEDTGEGMSKKQLIDECLTIFIAGNETSAMAMSWCIILLNKHPEAVEKLRNEYEQVIGENGAFTLENIMQLTYTMQVVKETMRLYPPAWVIGRRAKTDDIIDGYKIKSSNNIMLSVYNIHHSPKFWDEPEKFKPERFTKENMKAKHKYAYMPFGGGPRLCIGNNFALMEMQIILAKLINQFEFIAEYTKTPEMEPLITLRPKGGVPIKIKEKK